MHFLPKIPDAKRMTVWLWVLAGWLPQLSGESLRMNNRVIETGMSKGKVFLIAGEPDWKTHYFLGDRGMVRQFGEVVTGFSGASRIIGYSGSLSTGGAVSVEEWLFNRGKYRLMQLLRFEDERLVAIESLGYGFSERDPRPAVNPDWSLIQPGDTAYEVLHDLGEPSLVEKQPSIRFVEIFGPRLQPLHFRSAEVSWWYYNQGSDRLFRIVKLVNGRVVEIETEGFGVDP